MKKNTIFGIRIWNEITSIIVSLLLIAFGGYLISGSLIIPFFEAVGSKIVGWVIGIIGAVSLFSSIGGLIVHRK